MMTILSVDNISKTYAIEPLFEEVTFALDDRDRVGLIGSNGSGKTTLLRIVAGQEEPDSGRVMLAGDPIVGYLEQNPPMDESLTILETIFEHSGEAMHLVAEYEKACHEIAGSHSEEAMRRASDLAARLEATGAWDIETNARVVLSKLGIDDTEQRVGELSGGQRKRVRLAHALIQRPDLLILDEPTNHLDAETIEWLEDYLRRYSGALLLVTHDRYFLDRVTTRIIELDRRTFRNYHGNYHYYLEKKEEEETRRAVEERKRQSLIRQERAWLLKGAKARTTKQKARIERAEDLMSEPRERERAAIEMGAASRRLGSKVIELRGISKRWDGTPLIEDFTYIVTPGERLGIIGPNGSGKTTLLEIIAGRLQPDAGSVERGITVAVGYYDQEGRALDDEMRVIDYIREVSENVRTADGSVITASQMLERFLFAGAMQYAPIAKLSGGERRRLYLLRVLMSAPNVLLLDEPTNDLDIMTLMALEDYLDSFAGSVVVVSHDRYFLDRTVEHLFRFDGTGAVREYPGSYSTFLQIRDREASEQSQQRVAPEKQARTDNSAADRARGLSYRERKELARLEEQVAELEEKKTATETALSETGNDYVKAADLAARLAAIEAELARTLDRWTELAEREG